MEDQRIKKILNLSTEETFLGIMRYLQVCHAAVDFPYFPGREWDELLAIANRLAERRFHQSLDIGFLDASWGQTVDGVSRGKILAELEFTTIVDRETGRIRLDVEESTWGMKFGRDFPKLAEDIFSEALAIPGFIMLG